MIKSLLMRRVMDMGVCANSLCDNSGTVNRELLWIALSIRDHLLSSGGSKLRIRLPDDELIDILGRGQFMSSDASLCKGSILKDLACAELVDCAEYSIGSGFALDKHGVWSRRIWFVKRMKFRYKVIDIFDWYQGYFGYIMTHSEYVRYRTENSDAFKLFADSAGK